MTDEATLQDIPGGRALLDWFGSVHRFHDAELLEIDLNSKGPSTLRIHTWRMTDKVDARGYFELDKHVVVTITLEGVTDISLAEFNLPGIIFDLEVTTTDESTQSPWNRSSIQLTWSGSYGVAGTLRAKTARFDLQPGKPAGG